MTQGPTDDIDFWSRQLSEHALFMQLGLEDAPLRARADQLHKAWERYRGGSRDVQGAISLVLETRGFKLEVFDRLNRGEWLGWLWPLFIDHIRREGDYFLGILQGTPLAPGAECQAWLTFMAEHAAFARQLLDPSEAAQIQRALELQGQFTSLFHHCGSTIGGQLTALSERSGQDLDAYLNALGIGKPDGVKSIIHPVLAEHVVREGRRFLVTMQALRHVAGV